MTQIMHGNLCYANEPESSQRLLCVSSSTDMCNFLCVLACSGWLLPFAVCLSLGILTLLLLQLCFSSQLFQGPNNP